MSISFKTEEYYKRFIELQEKLRKSEEERLKLEMKFNDMVQTTREEEQIHYRKLRAQYKRFLEEDRRRQDRNERILRTLERIESRVSMLVAKTERFKLLRQQYQFFLDRIYKVSHKKESETSHVPRENENVKPVDSQGDILQTYLQTLSSQKLRELVKKEEDARTKLSGTRSPDATHNYGEFYSFNENESKPNYANSIADDIMNSLYSRTSRPIDSNKYRQPRERNIGLKAEIHVKEPETQNLILYDFDNLAGIRSYPSSLQKPSPTNETLKNVTAARSEDFSAPYESSYKNPIELSGAKVKDYTYMEKNMYNREEPILDNEMKTVDQNRMVQNSEKQKCMIKDDNISTNNVPVHQDTSLDGSAIYDKNSNNTQVYSNVTENKFYHLNQPESEPLEETVNQESPMEDQEEIEKVVEQVQTVNKIQKCEIKDYNYKETTPEPKISVEDQLSQILEPKGEETVLLEKPKEQEEKSALNEPQADDFEPKLEERNVNFPVHDNIEKYHYQQQPLNGSAAELPESRVNLPNVESDQYQQQETVQQYLELEQPVERQQYYDKTIKEPAVGENVNQPIEQYDETGQPMLYDHYGKSQYDENGQLIQQYDESGQPLQVEQYDQSGQPLHMSQYDEQGQFVQQYDEAGQPIGQYDENAHPVEQYEHHTEPPQQYDEHGQFLQQYDPNAQYDENGQIIPQYHEQYDQQLLQQYDEHGQMIQQYDENGQPVQQYDENLLQQYDSQQPFQQYDENGQVIQQYDLSDPNAAQPQYDENGQVMQQYDLSDPNASQPQYDEHGQIMQQFEGNEAQLYNDDQQIYNRVESTVERMDNQHEKDIEPVSQEDISGLHQKQNLTAPEDSKKASNVMEMLDTDTESAKQDTRVSHDSDFDFSNG